VFQDAFERYLTREAPRSGFPTATPLQPACLLIETNFSNRYTKADVADAKTGSNPHEHCNVAAVADENSPREGLDTRAGSIGLLPSCPKCGSFAVHREEDGSLTCETCEVAS
jgi:hypothetical protein